MSTFFDDIIRSRAFWVDYLSASTSYQGCETLHTWTGTPTLPPLLFPIFPPHVRLTLQFSLPGVYSLELNAYSHQLSLRRYDPENFDQLEPMLLGMMDAHQMSDVFRWEEFQAIIRRLAERYVPRWALELLLQHYVAITVDCAEQHRALLQDCLQKSQVFTTTEIDYIVGYSQSCLRRDFRWRHDPEWGWIAEGRDAWSLRRLPITFNEEDEEPRFDTHFDFIMFEDFMNTIRY